MLPIHNNYRKKCPNISIVSIQKQCNSRVSNLQRWESGPLCTARSLDVNMAREGCYVGTALRLLHALACLALFCLELACFSTNTNNQVHPGSYRRRSYAPSYIVLLSFCIPAATLSACLFLLLERSFAVFTVLPLNAPSIPGPTRSSASP